MRSNTYRKRVAPVLNRRPQVFRWSIGIVLIFGLLTAPPARGQCELQKLTASDAMERDVFGSSADMDGDYLVIGARNLGTSSGRPGAAYVYRRHGIEWVEQQRLTASDGALGDRFGVSVSISGNVIAIGASVANAARGAVYVYRLANGTWVEEAKLVPADVAESDFFGKSTAIDGNYIVAGATGHDEMGSIGGAAYAFFYDGNNWVEQDEFTASDVATSDGFGGLVSLNGGVAVISSFGKNAGYVFRRNGTTWVEEAKLIPSDLAAEDDIAAVAIRGDDIALGYTQHSGAASRGSADLTSGVVYPYRYFAGAWMQSGELRPGSAEPFALFGHSIDIGETHLVVGAPGDQPDDPGAAYIFRQIGQLWTAQIKITASDGSKSDNFGRACTTDDEYVVIGASNDGDACPKKAITCASGSAYVYWQKSSPACEEIPATSTWGLVVLVLLLLGAGSLAIRRRTLQGAKTRILFAATCILFSSGVQLRAEPRPRTPLPKASRVTRPSEPSQLEIKFRNNLRVRAVSGNLTSLTGGDINDTIAVQQQHGLTFEQLIKLPQEALDAIETEGESRSGVERPDFAGMMIVRGADEIIEVAANALLSRDEVEWVDFTLVNTPDSDCDGGTYASRGPICSGTNPPCACDINGDTCDYFSWRLTNSTIKDYHGPDPGMDMNYAWSQGFPPGYRGQGINLIDTELSYNPNHEDLCEILGPQFDEPFDDHGSGVLGILVAADNGYGWTGLVPDATAWVFSRRDHESVCQAMLEARLEEDIVPGDIFLIENGVNGDPLDTANGSFVCICSATQAGYLVFAVAGNGTKNLDAPPYELYHTFLCDGFPIGDSGMTIVGGGSPDTVHKRLDFSTYGLRVNLQGWGDDVSSLGGQMKKSQLSGVEGYTNALSGTSFANPMVAAAAASLQSLSEAEFGGARLLPMQMRKILVDTGFPQGGKLSKHIGPFPNMKDAIDDPSDGLRHVGTQDCNANGVGDVREIWEAFNTMPQGVILDCNHNNILDSCDILGGISPDCDTNGIPDECETTIVPPKLASPEPGYQKNRYLSFLPRNPGKQTALRVTLVASDVSGAPIGSHWWVTAPLKICENSGQANPPPGGCGPAPGIPAKWFWASSLICSATPPGYQDWHGECIGVSCVGGLNPGTSCTTDADCQEVLYVSGAEILPGSLYTVQAIESDLCEPTNENSFSAPMGISTPIWGDIVDVISTCPNGPPNGTVDTPGDVISVSNKFQNNFCAPIKGRVDVDPMVPDRIVTIVDVLKVLSAFQVVPYPFTPPAACP